MELNLKIDMGEEPLIKRICPAKYHEDNDKLSNCINLDIINNNSKVNIPDEKTAEIELESLAAPNRKSPKKRLSLPSTSSSPTKKHCSNNGKSEIFQYGNYTRYYSYRNLKQDFHDIRLEIINTKCPKLFETKQCLDIGCNNGMITMEIAKKFNIESIIGLDIDKTLINRVKKIIEKKRKFFNGNDRTKFPFNINFIHGNYVLRDSILLEIETEQFDVIVCLSVTKWIHLNFGDEGLKQAFKRMYLQLRPGGKLILESQQWKGYKRRKNLTPEINVNYINIKFFPKDFTQYLLSNEIGFGSVLDLGIPNHSIKGFQRPIQIFNKI